MDAATVLQIQQAIVRSVTGNVADTMEGEWEDRAWVHLFVDFELEQVGGRSSSITFALAHKPRQPLERIAFRLPPAAKQHFTDLAAAMQQPDQDRWSTAQLRIEQDGSFAFDFSYAPPFRLGGQLIDKRFEDYRERWLATSQGRQFTQAEHTRRHGLWAKLASFLAPDR